MAQNPSHVCTPPVNCKIAKATCSCSHCDINNASEQQQDLTCSCEDCTEPKSCLYYTKKLGGLSENHMNACCVNMQINLPANPSLSQLRKKFKQRTTSPTAPSEIYAVMTATLKKQESIVGLQKRAYLSVSETKQKKGCVLEKCSCIGDQVYGVMTRTLKRQESIVGLQKRAYLPASETKPEKGCVLEKCTCIGDQVYGVMTATLKQQESIVGLQKRAYLPASEIKPEKECDLKKCSCIISDPCPIQNRDKKESLNLCGANFSFEVPKIYHVQELPDYLNGAVGYVFDVPKICCDKQESSKVPKSCGSLDRTKSAMGYTFDLPTICCVMQESHEVPKICHTQESPDYIKGAAGYVFDVPKICCVMQESHEVPKIYNTQESPDHMKGAAGYGFDLPKICCVMQESHEVPKIYHTQESPDHMKGAAGYVFDVPKICCDKQESSALMKGAAGYVFDVPKICCDKQKSPDYMKGAAGYVFDVPKICCDKQESPDYMKGAAGYVFDVPKVCCDKQESPDYMKGAVGYVLDVPKFCCDKQESPDYMKAAAGYVFDVSKIFCDRQESPDYIKGAAGYVLDVPKFCCDKQESPDYMKGAAGYVFDVSKICCDKQESPDYMKGAAGYVFDVPKICYDKQESPDRLNSVTGYVFELPKTYKEQRQCCKEYKIKRYKKKTIYECNMCNASETPSSSETKIGKLGSENSTQVFNVSRLGSKRTISDTTQNCCQKNNELDVQQYKLTKNAQGLFKKILQTQENALQIKNTLSGYVYELPKYSSITQKKSCDCRESVKNKSASHNITESSPHEPANNTRKIGINRHKEKAIVSDSKNKLIKKNSCEAPGYVWVVPKPSTKHYDHKKQKCECNEFAKYKSDNPGYGLEQKNKINNCVFAEPAERKPKLPECAYDIPICREIDNAERVWKNKKSSECKCKKKNESESSGYAYKLPKYTYKLQSQKNTCVCRESVYNKSASPECAQELTKFTHKLPSQKNGCACRESVRNKSALTEYTQELAKSTHKLQSQKSCSECRESVSKAGKIQSELSGYVFVVPKETEKSCVCTQSANNSSKSLQEAANNSELFNTNRLELKCIQPDIESSYCKSMVGTQTVTNEVLQSLDLPHPASKNTIDLCKYILKNQADTIEVLRNLYKPQKSQVISTCCSPSLTELSDTIKRYKNAATQPGTTNLSAEVCVHEPDAELKDCLTCGQSNTSNKQKKISKSDIIKRLKEAYKACSCKICDCFNSSKPVKTDESKPCECDKCWTSLASLETKEQPPCSCKPCDCVQCTKTLAEQCHCDPCECGDCKTKSIHQGQSFLVAPVVTEENAPRVACACSPCGCIECGLVYPLASTIVNEMSTSTNRHSLCRCEICLNESCDQSGFDSCKCQKRNKVVSKPVEHDIREFDIRTARIVHNTPMFQRVGRNDTIAMFAAIPSRYPNFDDNLSNTQTSSCKECECIFCVCQKDAIDTIKSSQLFSSNKSKSDFNDRYNNCELKMPYECQLIKKIQSDDKCCVCDTCDCLNCETSIMSKNLYRFGRHRYSDGPYERRSKKETSERTLRPFKKGDVLTPSTHKLKIQKLILQKQHLEEPSCSIPKVTTNTDSTFKLRDVDIFHELTSEFNTSNSKIGSITQANSYMNDFNTRYIHECKTFKWDAYMQEINKRRSLHKHFAIDNEISGRCFSDHSSSYYKRYGSNTLIAQKKSGESSCNSSGYNYPEYLIHFPKGTAETRLKDELKLDIDETMKLDKCNIIGSITEKHNVDKISYDNMTGNENCCMINECNYFSNNKLIAKPTESNNNNSENAHIVNMRRNCKNGLHVQLNNRNDKHNNLGNNVLRKRERNDLQNATCSTASQSSLKMNNDNRENMNTIHDCNEYHVARNVYYNISEENTSRLLLPIHDRRYTWKSPKQTTYSDFVNGAEILNAHDYKRVRNTLIEAKKFSLELIRLLNTYEKANDDFESISEKLKLSHPIKF